MTPDTNHSNDTTKNEESSLNFNNAESSSNPDILTSMHPQARPQGEQCEPTSSGMTPSSSETETDTSKASIQDSDTSQTESVTISTSPSTIAKVASQNASQASLANSSNHDQVTSPPPQDLFKLKEIAPSLKIILQNKNGPCPLLALANALALRDGKSLGGIHPDESFIDLDRIVMILADRILTTVTVKDENVERMVQDAISILPRMAKGLDVNVKFDGGFEFTDVLEVFDLFTVPVLHGWCVDPDDTRWAILSKLSYNTATERVFLMMDLVEKDEKTDEDKKSISEGHEIQSFLQDTQGQLTEFGLARLSASLRENGVGIFYWNGHFSTIVKHKDRIFLLATDEGYYNESDIVYQRLESARGDSAYCRGDFSLLSEPPSKDSQPKNQVDADFQLALQIQQQEDERMRKREQRQQQQAHPQQQHPSQAQMTHPQHQQHSPPPQQYAPPPQQHAPPSLHTDDQHVPIPHRKPRKPSPKASAYHNDPKMRYKNSAANLASLNEERRQRQHVHQQQAALNHYEQQKNKQTSQSHKKDDKCVIS
mmetsp:Transcript_5086/g.19065  ORF Transcript_5086/g.19065 Transcript_5086/m.19065 type:complete len:540 (+) Transcript_5086:39-1658(+)